VELFLDGDRDHALRRELAERHARAAEAAAARALAAPDAHTEEEERTRALGEASRALALDPRSDSAVHTMARLMMQPPRVLPPAAEDQLQQDAQDQMKQASRGGALVYCSWLLFTPLVFWLGMRDARSVALTAGLMAAAALASFIASRRDKHGGGWQLAVLLLSNAGIAAASRSFGPFTIVPGIAAVNAMGFLMLPHLVPRWTILLVGALTMIGPVGLEYAGVLPHSYVFDGRGLLLVPQMHDLTEARAMIALVIIHLGILLISATFVMRARGLLTAAERRLRLYAWHLGKLVPGSALDGITPAAAPAPEHAAACSMEELLLRRGRDSAPREA
jgi:hypothetical protein